MIEPFVMIKLDTAPPKERSLFVRVDRIETIEGTTQSTVIMVSGEIHRVKQSSAEIHQNIMSTFEQLAARGFLR